jgi:hypothetical protein
MDSLIIASILFAGIGTLLMSFVQVRIIRQYGVRHFSKRGFINVYWSDRSKIEKWCFWLGLLLLLSPFFIVGFLGE